MMKKTVYITNAAAVAALYVVLTYISNLFGLANGAVQLRLSEALTVLPYFMPAAIPGLTLGCLIANIVTGCTVADIIFGTLATLIGAAGTFSVSKLRLPHSEYLAPLPPIVVNTVVVPLVIIVSVPSESLWFVMLTVFAGELLSCGVLGIVLSKCLEKTGILKKR